MTPPVPARSAAAPDDVNRTIAELSATLASGALSAERLLLECLDRIARHDGELKAMLARNPDAMADACACDVDRRAGRTRGPVHGITIVVKDNIDVAGLPTTSGCLALAGAMPRRDAAIVGRLRAAGAVIVGKTNLSEFAFEIRTRSSLGGDTRNPFARGVTCGGSSGGAAVAVAAGFAVAGLGTDTGGSIRVPAAYTGLVGLRPTHGRLEMAGIAPLAPSTDTVAPIARSVGDARLLFDIMRGDENRPAGQRALRARVGLFRQAFGNDAGIGAAIETAADALRRSGITIVDPVTMPEQTLPRDGAHIVDAEFVQAFDAYLRAEFDPGTVPNSLAALLASGAFLPEYEAALRLRMAADAGSSRAAILARHGALRTALTDMMDTEGLDAVLYPTSRVVPESLDNPNGGWAPELAACSGWPALSLPSGKRLSGIPVGVELLARADDEALLFQLGAMIERAAGPRLLPAL